MLWLDYRWVPAWEISMPVGRFACLLGGQSWQLGFQVNPWGLRLMFFTQHLCIHRKENV